jgi:hypothetical protein
MDYLFKEYVDFLKDLNRMVLPTHSKVNATIQTVIAFLIISLPFTYKITNNLLSGILGELADSSGCPTTRGLLIHSLVFGVIVYYLMILSGV